MRFAKIIGHSSSPATKKVILEAQEKLSSVFTELSLGWDNKSLGSSLGGDPLVFQLVYPLNHYCDITSIQLDELDDKHKEIQEKLEKGEPLSEEEKPLDEDIKTFRRKMAGRVLRTAATSGVAFYWNPEFVSKLTKIGLRLVVFHESYHALYMHVSRRGSRLPRLWNIAVDYRVNFSAMEDLKARDIKDYPKVFTDNLGEYILLEEYASFLRDPFNPPPRLAHLNPMITLRKMADPAYKAPGEDLPPMYYADPNLSDDMKRPENVYDYLLAQIPKCPKCGRLGKYKKPDEYKSLEKKIKDQEDKKKKEQEKKDKQDDHSHGEEEHDHDHADGEPCDCPSKNQQPGEGQGETKSDGSCCEGPCSECGGDDSTYVDPFGAGDTLDDHMDSDVSEEELGKRISDAMEIAKKMAGKIPGSLEDELGQLIAPKLTWQDFIRARILKARNGYGKNDWTRPKSRPMFAGLYSPKKRDHFVKFLAAYDCSGSMSQEDIAFGISQLRALDERAEGYLLAWDCQPYYSSMVKIKKANLEELQKAKVVGRGGTAITETLNTYEEHTGPVDLVVIITDSFLYDGELTGVKQNKNTDYIWLVTSHNPHFKPPFGRVFNLLNE